MNPDNHTSTATINGLRRGLPVNLRGEPRVVIHPPSPPEDRAAMPPAAARAARESLVASGSTWRAEAPLGRDPFLRMLQHEKRRSDRSGAPLSMVLYQLSDSEHSPRARAIKLLDALGNNKRETDVLGVTGPGSMALLFPDTPGEGARHFIAKMAALGFEHGVGATAATYPGVLFEELVGTIRLAPPPETDLHPQAASSLAGDAADPDASDGYFVKRALDILGALLALALVSPLLIATALAIAVTSPGPIIFKQKRLGKSGKPFVFYKFRSMHCDADDSIHRQYVANLIKGEASAQPASPESGGKIYKIRSDPRISPIGRIIRRTSIDELPQLFNVLRGEMSLVGPRPPLPYEAESYQAWHLRRVWAMRPGITGLWQVEGRSRVPFDEMVRMDLRYIHHCSLALDLKILLKTVKVVLRCEGAV